MRLRTEPQLTQIHLRTPRVPSVPFTNNSFSKALTKEIFLFDQSFFFSKEHKKSVSLFDQIVSISKAFKKRVFLFEQSVSISKASRKRVFHFDQSFLISKASKKRVFLFDQSFLIRIFPLKQFLFKIVFSQYYICFPTSVF